MNSYVVLLSSGLDSTVNLYAAAREGAVKIALTFDYGQRAAPQEIEHSRKLCEKLKVPHKIIALPWLREITATSLVNREADVPVGSDVNVDSHAQSSATAKRVWVPNRNGAFLNIAAAFAESMGAQYVVPGFNLEEAATFPDNTVDFMKAMDVSLQYSTASNVRTKCFTHSMNKIEIVKLGRELGVDFSLVWPCYFAGPTLCEKCESCQRYFRAMRAAGPNLADDILVEDAPVDLAFEPN